jgi:uncharacterized membrane protein YeaQ/YmgE (transglycosylase-associated protein family)
LSRIQKTAHTREELDHVSKLIIPGNEPGGIFITMLIGIVGSFLGTFIGRAVGHYGPDQSAGFIMSLIGALILLGIYHFFKSRTSRAV